jgi:hypothetical protein
MAPAQPIVVLDPLPWTRSTLMESALHEHVNGGQLAPNVEGAPPAWIVPPAMDREPNPPYGYVVSIIRHHERGFTTPASRFMRGLCYHYGVELHNFAPNAMRDASASGGVCRWPDVLGTGFTQGVVLPVHDDVQQCGVGEGVVLPLQRRRRPPPYTSKVLKAKTDAWHHSVSPSSRQDRLESLINGLKSLADAGLGEASVLTNLHRRRIVPLIVRELRIFEMTNEAAARAFFSGVRGNEGEACGQP